MGTSKLYDVVANDLSGLIGTTEVVSNETNRIVTGTLPRPSADVERVRNIAANVLWLHSERVRNSINC